MPELPNSGSYMPPEFWFAMAVLFGTAFIGLLIWVVNRFLTRMEATTDWLKENVIMQGKRLDQNDKKFDEHEKQFDRVYKILEQTVKKK